MKQIKNLFRRAKAHKIKLVELAQECDCHVDTFQKWKNGTNSPTLKTLGKTVAALNRLIAQKYAKNAGAQKS